MKIAAHLVAPGLIQVKAFPGDSFILSFMQPFVFRCPTTGMNVQAFADQDEKPPAGEARYRMTECLACRGFHLVDPETGELMLDRR